LAEAQERKTHLGELAATAICGNDITSSCLYVSALAIFYAGKWAPVALLLVGGLLYLFRSIYGEVVGALPLNGGAYNALLNTTSKFRASMAACLTILSYMATAVISANEAMHYVHTLWEAFPIIPATIGLLALFMVLSILGITESARVAVIIFLTHLSALVILLVLGIARVAVTGTAVLSANLHSPSPGGFAAALFFGFCAAMLGISGFESSSNFVEEQKKGVFPKTLRNMWVAVTILNPGMALLALALMPVREVGEHQEALLAHMGSMAGGGWLGTAISVDAALVLSGAVLTSYVGVNGLIHRMTLDRCLPQFLLKTGRRGTTHRIIILFFLLSVSVLLITQGDLKALAGVYTLSFLAVMFLFGVGNILLKVKRSKLKRPVQASWPGVLVAVAAVLAGLVGNAVKNPGYVRIFLHYFIPTAIIVSVMLGRIALLRAWMFVVQGVSSALSRRMRSLSRGIRKHIELINSQQFVFFTKGDDISNLNHAMLYVRKNEQTNRIKVVTVAEDEKDVPEKLAEDLLFLDKAYPEIDIEYIFLRGQFGPELIRKLSDEWGIPPNFMFIGSPGGRFPFELEELGGVRLII